jgi:hypothetical protein
VREHVTSDADPRSLRASFDGSPEFYERFDAVVAFNSLHWVDSELRLSVAERVDEIREATRSGG